MNKTNWQLGLAFSLLTAILWGILPIALKGLLPHMDVMTINWYRFSVAALLALLWYGHRSGPAIRRLFSSGNRPITLFAITGLLGNYVFYLLGLDRTTPSASQIIIQLAPLLLLLCGLVMFRERLSRLQWAGVATFTLGLLLFFHLRLTSFVSTDLHYLLGVGFVVIAAISWTVYGLAQKKILASESSNDLLLLIYIAGALVFFPFAEPAQITRLGSTELALLGFVALNTIIAYGSFGLAMTHWDVSRVSAAITPAPLFTLLFGQLLGFWQPGFIDTERLDWLSWSGAAMVVAGSAVTALAKSPPRLDS